MNKALKITLLCVSTLLATQVFSAPIEQAFMSEKYILQASVPKDIVLLPGKPQVIINPLTVSLIADCTILNMGSEDVTIAATVLKKTGIVNGITFTTDEFVRMPIEVDETFQIIAHPGAQVSLLNEGEFNVITHCLVKILT